MPRVPLLVLATALTVVPWGQAQGDRYHVGLRLRAFEAAWDEADATARKRGAGPLKAATTAFFSFRLGEVARHLDTGRQALRSAAAPPADVAWADSLALTLDARLVDPTAVGFRVRPLYAVAAVAPKDAALRLTLLLKDKPAREPQIFPIAELPVKEALSLKGLSEGDYALRVEVVRDGKALATLEQGVSVASRAEERVKALGASLAGPEGDARTPRETARMLAALLRRLRDGGGDETDYLAARLLAEAEAVAAGKNPYGERKTGQFWLTLATPKGKPVVRLQVPEAAAKGEPLPLVVALHGAGGSENLFFDGYGRGCFAAACARRGWLMVAPRNAGGGTPLADLLDAVNSLVPIDRKKVFLVGHSMGAGQAVGFAGQEPTRFAAVAALGGGGRARSSDALKGLPFFVGVGTDDFALSGSRALAKTLRDGGVATVELKEYADIEHMAIVRAAVDDVFAFFEKSSASR